MARSAVLRANLWRSRLRNWRGPKSSRERLLFALISLAIMVAMVIPMFADTIDYKAPAASGGLLDIPSRRDWSKPFQVAGQWRFTWLGPRHAAQDEPSDIMNVPGLWTNVRLSDGTTLPENGRARYEITLRGLPPARYEMHLPVIWAGNRVFIDSRQVSGRGMVGDSPRDTQYFLRAQDIVFDTTGADVVLTIEMASFLHRENGLEEPPVLGTRDAMDQWYALKWSREHLYNVSLLLIAAIGIAVFLFRPQDRASLYFGMSCLWFLPTAAILGFDNVFQIMLPQIPFSTSLAIQYLSGVVAVTFFFLNAHELFPRESSKFMARAILSGFGLIFLIHSIHFLTGDTLGASHTQQRVFMLLALFTLAYMVAILIRAVWNRRDGSFIYLLGIGLFAGSFALNTSVMSGWVRRDQVMGYEFSALGMIMLLYSHVVLMAERWSLSVGRAEQINDDLRQLIEVNTAITSDLQLGSLLDKMVSVTSKVIRADRSSLFLKDGNNPELASMVAQGIDSGQIRVDVGRGLAGYVYATGETVNLAEAYADERFNRSVDETTGYRTRSVLTVPITARDGRRIGVMQALNREDGQPFTEDDAARMTAFGAQAAVAIDNAQLFAEAVSARNFDDSILRSMSGGVIALDLDWKITKLNAAAAEIVGASKTLLGGLDARSLLNRNNPWLIAEVEAVIKDGEPRALLDVELVTARDKPSSANITITALHGEDGPVGTLLVIEDISEEKRLQGTMRRFMTQSVVEQVLSRDEAALFGTACDASVLFADIRGFTSMAEELSARETVETLNELFTDLYEAVSGHDGVLDKYIGDAIMAVFGAPLSSGRDPQNAIASGLQMLQMLDNINAKRLARGQAEIRIGIGIASGELVAGTIGSPKRMDYTVIGDSVNLAARLQDLTKAYGVEFLIDEATARALGDEQPLREIDLIAVRGRKRAETVFEVLARVPADTSRYDAMLKSYAEGRERLIKRDWPGALDHFKRAVELVPGDRPAELMFARAQALAAAPPPESWDGIWRPSMAIAT